MQEKAENSLERTWIIIPNSNLVLHIDICAITGCQSWIYLFCKKSQSLKYQDAKLYASELYDNHVFIIQNFIFLKICQFWIQRNLSYRNFVKNVKWNLSFHLTSCFYYLWIYSYIFCFYLVQCTCIYTIGQEFVQYKCTRVITVLYNTHWVKDIDIMASDWQKTTNPVYIIII